jgi:hypothetical protein
MTELLNDTQLTTADIANPSANQQAKQVRADPENYAPANDTANRTTTATGDVAASNGQTVRPAAASQNSSGPLFPEDELHNFRASWDQVQTSFVDEPRQAVEEADSLVANVVKRIAERFAQEREQLEKRWDRGDSVNTEDLRQAFKLYRAFFDRLLTF